MQNIVILYYSKTGSTKKMAEKIASGVESVGLKAKLRTVPNISANCEKSEDNIPDQGIIYVSKNDIRNCSGIIIGSPSYFGNIASPLKYFIDTTSDLWIEGALTDKPAAVFTSSSTMHGGQESTILSMMLPLIHHGAIIVGLPYSSTILQNTITGGSPYGASHYNGRDSNYNLSKDEILLAKLLGKRVALFVKKIN